MGLEPTTRGLKGRCSNQLSYGPARQSEAFLAHPLASGFRFMALPLPLSFSNSRVGKAAPWFEKLV